jgi:pyrroline-5-carboxylate reductase
MRSYKRIGIIGTGKMGTALISGLLKARIVERANLCASDISSQRCHDISQTYGIECLSDNKALVANSDIVIIAVEPRHVKEVLEEIGDELTNQLIVSLAAGISIDFLKRSLLKPIPIVRVMPNTPCMVGEGMTVITFGAEVSEEMLKVVKEIFSSIGKILLLDESFFDAVTGLSGSGPAYAYIAIEGLVEGGLKAGLPEDVALTLAAQTVVGSGKMVLETRMHPASLREMVTTPGGVTIEGIKELEQGDVKSSFMRAVEKATQRAKELAKR